MLTAALLVSSCLVAQTPADFAKLVVTAKGFEGTNGVALFQIYANEDTWLDEPVKTAKARIKDGKALVTIVGLMPGTYAVSVTHDANNNGKMDMAWLPYPHPGEGGGVSNDAEGTIGPPSWEDAMVVLKKGPNSLAVRIAYY